MGGPLVQWVRIHPAMQGDTGSISGPRRFLHGAGQLSPCEATIKPICLEPVLHSKTSHQNEPAHCNEEQLLHTTLEKAGAQP